MQDAPGTVKFPGRCLAIFTNSFRKSVGDSGAQPVEDQGDHEVGDLGSGDVVVAVGSADQLSGERSPCIPGRAGRAPLDGVLPCQVEGGPAGEPGVVLGQPTGHLRDDEP